MVVRGTVFGVTVIGNVTPPNQLARFAECAKTVELLRKQLAELFDEQIADMLIARLGKSSATLENGSVSAELEAHLASLASLGIIRKAIE
jgi:hypothetical protein